jgi:predicted ATPase
MMLQAPLRPSCCRNGTTGLKTGALVIRELTIKGFKSFEDISLELGKLNVFIGTNASGKTNFFDALRVLQGIGYGFTIDEIFNGKPKTANSEVWEPIRGGSTNVPFLKWDTDKGQFIKLLVDLQVQLKPSGGRSLDYHIRMSAVQSCVRYESLHIGGTPIYDSGPIDNSLDSPTFGVRYYGGQPGRQPHLHFEKSRPVLLQILRQRNISKRHAEMIGTCASLMTNTQRLDPSPSVLREYSKAPFVPRMGERGENFAALVNNIMRDEKTASAYISWLKQLTPTEMDEAVILTGALGEPLFATKKDEQVFPAPVLSDGTLRFAAIAAAFFQPDMPETLLIEEIENGIHPSRLRLLVELLKSQSQNESPQLIATTHSPVVLSWLDEADYHTTFFCKKDDDNRATEITPLSDIPKFTELVRRQPITDLFAEGWLEGAL